MRSSPSKATTSKGVGAKPWIKVRTDLWDDPRVSALCEKLKTTEATVIGGLVRLWSIADSHSVNGELPGMTGDTLDRKAGIPAFANALVDIGWLVVGDGQITIPDFSIHNGQSAKSRAQAALRQKNCRARAAESDREAQPNDVTPPSRKPRDANVTRVEKSRADKKKPPPPQTTANDMSADADWLAVEADFSILGLADVSGTTTLAQARGYSPQQVARLIEHFRASPGQWNAAAIAWRIGHSPSDRAFDQGWPKPHETTSTQSGDVERLETTYAKQLNGMSEKELLAAMERAGIPASKLAHCRQPGTSFRAQLLAKFASDAISNCSPPADSSKPKQKRTDSSRQ